MTTVLSATENASESNELGPLMNKKSKFSLFDEYDDNDDNDDDQASRLFVSLTAQVKQDLGTEVNKKLLIFLDA